MMQLLMKMKKLVLIAIQQFNSIRQMQSKIQLYIMENEQQKISFNL